MTLLTLVMAYGVAHARLVYSVALIAFAFVFQIVPNIAAMETSHDAAIVRLIHPNVEQSDKWDPDKMESIYQRHMALTQADAISGFDRVVGDFSLFAHRYCQERNCRCGTRCAGYSWISKQSLPKVLFQQPWDHFSSRRVAG